MRHGNGGDGDGGSRVWRQLGPLVKLRGKRRLKQRVVLHVGRVLMGEEKRNSSSMLAGGDGPTNQRLWALCVSAGSGKVRWCSVRKLPRAGLVSARANVGYLPTWVGT